MRARPSGPLPVVARVGLGGGVDPLDEGAHGIPGHAREEQEGDDADADQDRLTKWFAGLVDAGHKVLMSNRCVPGDSFFEDRLGDIADFHYIDVVYTAGRRKVTAEGFEAKPAQEILIVSR